MEESAFLLAVKGIIGGVKVQDNLLGSLGVCVEKAIDEEVLDSIMIGYDFLISSCLRQVLGSQFQPIQGAFSSQCAAPVTAAFAVGSCRVLFSRSRRQKCIPAQCIVVIQIFISASEPQNPLRNQLQHRMLDAARVAVILEASSECLQKSRALGYLPQQ